uniref:UBC core domain-containing protein n=1 Tax=Palpitomonas bilix TaxID=652834 RepID=A0A7S3LU90_9EUKA
MVPLSFFPFSPHSARRSSRDLNRQVNSGVVQGSLQNEKSKKKKSKTKNTSHPNLEGRQRVKGKQAVENKRETKRGPFTMLKLLSLKEKQKPKTETTDDGKKKLTSGQLRLQKDISEGFSDPNVKVSFKNPDDLMNFEVAIKIESGFYKGGRFLFTFKVPDSYPHKPPKVHCETKVYHPNIDEEGNVCLNILREDWKPVLNINSCIMGLQFLFLEPNEEDPLNKEAAALLGKSKEEFARAVRHSFRGYYNGRSYESFM